VLVEVDPPTGKARSIERLSVPYARALHGAFGKL
jgi:hypothetical protein